MGEARAAAAMAAGLILVVAVVAGLRPLPARIPPPPLPAAACEGWMADAIPRVGPKTREQVAAAIRHGEVPASAGSWFSR